MVPLENVSNYNNKHHFIFKNETFVGVFLTTFLKPREVSFKKSQFLTISFARIKKDRLFGSGPCPVLEGRMILIFCLFW